jgi:putative tributyrin esterase
MSSSMTVLLPQPDGTQTGLTHATGTDTDAPAVLYLLHGLGDDDTTWTRFTALERYVSSLGLAVIMPAVQSSFYTDEAFGASYWTFLSEELPELVSSFFRVRSDRDSTFVAGLSMGGYGAMKWALRQPWRFAAAASMSGALDIVRRREDGIDRPGYPKMFRRILGDGSLPPGVDLFELARSARGSGTPRLWLGCGSSDELRGETDAFGTACRDAGHDVTMSYNEGDHDWSYWDAEIQRVLGWMIGPADRAGG